MQPLYNVDSALRELGLWQNYVNFVDYVNFVSGEI